MFVRYSPCSGQAGGYGGALGSALDAVRVRRRRIAASGSESLSRPFPTTCHIFPCQVGDGGALGAALEHCMYAGGALGRVGLDFRAALPPLFESRILALFTQVWCSGVCEVGFVRERSLPSLVLGSSTAAAVRGAHLGAVCQGESTVHL